MRIPPPDHPAPLLNRYHFSIPAPPLPTYTNLPSPPTPNHLSTLPHAFPLLTEHQPCQRSANAQKRPSVCGAPTMSVVTDHAALMPSGTLDLALASGQWSSARSLARSPTWIGIMPTGSHTAHRIQLVLYSLPAPHPTPDSRRLRSVISRQSPSHQL